MSDAVGTQDMLLSWYIGVWLLERGVVVLALGILLEQGFESRAI